MKIFEILENSWHLAKKTYKFTLIPAILISFITEIIYRTLPIINLAEIKSITDITLLPVITSFLFQIPVLYVANALIYALLHESTDYKKVGIETGHRFHKILGITFLSALLLLPFSAILFFVDINQVPKIMELIGIIITAALVLGVSIAVQSAPLIILEKNSGIIAALKESVSLVKKNFIEKTANYIGSLFIAIVVVGLSAFVVGSLLSLLGMGITKLFPTLAQPHVNLIDNTLGVLSGTYEQAIMLLASNAILVTWYKKVTNP